MSDANMVISYVETDEECVELHKFLCVISQPQLFAPIDAQDSMEEVLRVRDEGASLVVKIDNEIVGALGIVPVGWWYNKKEQFLADRWFFVYPQFHHKGISATLLAEASAIAHKAGLPLIITGKKRIKRLSNGTNFVLPEVITEENELCASEMRRLSK